MVQEKGGRMPRYKSVAEIEALAGAYLDAHRKKQILTKTGRPMVRQGKPVYEFDPPNYAGLALALGFTSIESLSWYKGRPSHMAAIERALCRVDDLRSEIKAED